MWGPVGLALARAAKRTLMTIRGFTNYSYQGQDLFVIDALAGLRGGYFLDSGASDGVNGSNSLLLESEFGWRGICVEPNNDLFARLSRVRECACVNCCLFDVEGDVAFYEAAGVLGGIARAYDPGHLEYVRSMTSLIADAEGKCDGIVVKNARTIRSVLREHGAPEVIDYWSLDTEGSELTLLQSFPFDEYVVRVLTVEHNFTPAREKIRRFLETHGYRVGRELGIDDAYVREVSPLDRAWRSRIWSSGNT